MTNTEIIALNNAWANSKHNINNPKNSWKPISTEHETATRTERIKDLNSLIEILYQHQSTWQSPSWIDQKNITDSFKRYIKNTLIAYYPFGFFNHNSIQLKDIQEHNNQADYLSFVNDLLNTKKGQSRGLKKILEINDKIEAETLTQCIQNRTPHIQLLAKLCQRIDSIQCRDFKQTQAYQLYGNRRALSAYLGQWIVRSYPFKDIVYRSKGFVQNQNTNNTKNIYEHYTPMSFFRDIIWWQPNHETLNDKTTAYSIQDWTDILSYLYRVVFVSKSENDLLDEGKFRSRRSFNTYSDSKVNVDIHEQALWALQYPTAK